MRILLLLLIPVVCLACDKTGRMKPASRDLHADSLIFIENDTISLEISLHGGAITSLRHKNDTLNPFTWRLEPFQMPVNNRKGAPYQGHFICIGRWGTPTSGEMAAGVPSNGEPANSWWEINERDDTLTLGMSVNAGLEQYSLTREIALSEKYPCFMVDETLTNKLNSGRFSAIIQHSTIGPPFFNPRTIVNSNATLGFNQSLIDTSLCKHEYTWPEGYADSTMKKIDMTRSDHFSRYVTTHVISDQYGWVTAVDPNSGLMLGYLWRSSDYPWLHLWHGILKGNLWARGLEFATTGLGNNFLPAKRAMIDFHGVNNNLFIDAMSSVSMKYLCFFLKTAGGFRETRSVNYYNDTIDVRYKTADGEEEIRMRLRAW